VKRLLETIPPKGKEFLQSIEHILEREKNWVSTGVNFICLLFKEFTFSMEIGLLISWICLPGIFLGLVETRWLTSI